jgi:hypothetical protein
MATTWTSRIANVSRKQIPQATANALNVLARGAAEDARAAGATMTIRERSLLRFFIRAPRDLQATKTRLVARVVVSAPKSAPADRGNVLTQQEESGVKRPQSGRSVAMPSRDIRKPGAKRKVIRGTELKNFLPLRQQSFVNSRQTVTAGRKNSFVVTLRKGRAAGRSMLLQRYGRGKRSVRGLWLFVRQTRLTPKLRFNATTKRHVQREVAAAFKQGFSQALATARALKATTQSSRL